MRTAIAWLVVSVAASAPLRAADSAGLSPGEFAEFHITLRLDERTGDTAAAHRGTGEARVYCLQRDAAGTHFVVLIRGDAGEDNAVRTGPAWFVLDPEGRLWPDLPGGKKISLDPSSWTVSGLLPALSADRLRAAGEWTAELDVPVYGDLHRLTLAHKMTVMSGNPVLERRSPAADVALKIGRKNPPVLRTYADRWMFDERGLVRDWTHTTALTIPVTGTGPIATTIIMTAKRLRSGRMTLPEHAVLRSDAARLKPVWEALVNPEPAESGSRDVAPLVTAIAAFRRTRADSRLFDGADVLHSNLSRLTEQAAAVQSEAIAAARLLNRPAPDFALKTPEGRTVRLSELRGRAVMLVFWGMGCRLCRTEAPHLTELHEKYGRRGFTVLAVEAFDNNADDVKTYLAEQKLRHPVLIQGAEAAGALYSIGGFPRAFWIDKSGKVVGRQVGFSSREALEKKIEELLGK